MDRLRYLDFELKIEREGNHYIARVFRSRLGEASNTFTLPFSEDKLENLVLKIGRLRTSTRHIYTSEMEAARELGGKLFEAVFDGEVLASLRSNIAEAGRQEETGLRIKLWLQDVGELADLPWEFLFDSSLNRFFAQSNQTPIVRYLEMTQRISPLRIKLPLRILVMISSPNNYVRLNVERERSLLQEALDPLQKKEIVQVEWVEQATLPALQRHLRRGEYHVFHFIGHGGFNREAEEGVLVLEDQQGRGWLAGAHRIGTVLHDHRTLRLAVLNSCEGARNSRTDPFAGVAANLVQQGIPAVVAMQFEITDEAAIIFASEFYTALAEGFPVDAAVAEARKAIYAQPNDVEWGTPVLYMRSPDGVLFNLKPASVTEKKLLSMPQTTSLLSERELVPPAERPEVSVPSPTDTTPQMQASTTPEDLSTDKSTKLIYHLIEIEEEERIRYDGKEISRNLPLEQTHRFQVSEDGENVEYKIDLWRQWFVRFCRISRNDSLIYSERPGLRILVCKGHRMEIQKGIIYYDGKEVSRQPSAPWSFIAGSAPTTHTFQVSEEGEKIEYKIDARQECEVSRNGKIIYTDRVSGLRKLWV